MSAWDFSNFLTFTPLAIICGLATFRLMRRGDGFAIIGLLATALSWLLGMYGLARLCGAHL